jgi:dCMP deaminase
MADWDKRWKEVLNLVKTWSKDRSTQVSAVIIDEESNTPVTFGYNGFPRGCDDSIESRHERPEKYLWTEHAEKNCIFNAAREGRSLDGKTLYVTMFPCADCARGIIQSGIKKVVTPKPNMSLEIWKKSFEVSMVMMKETGVEVVFLKK